MLRKVIAAWILGLGISAVTMVPSAMAVDMPELSEKISILTAAVQKQADRTDEALQKQDERLKKVEAAIIARENGNGRAPQTTRVVHHYHHYSPRYWCPPPWWDR